VLIEIDRLGRTFPVRRRVGRFRRTTDLVHAVRDLSFTVDRGEMVGYIGPNGAGKSTLAKAIMGLLRVRTGHVYLGGREVTGTGPHKLVRRGLAYLPQLANTFDDMSVQENLEMGGYTLKGDLRRRIARVLELFPDLGTDKHKKASALSVGLLVVEQNASLAMDHADLVCLLAQGRNVLSGKADELRERAEVARILVG
jgi:ABC-type branched-subunit amino acid transport system ATPase component